MSEGYQIAWARIQKVPCRQCAAAAQEPCRTPKGAACPPHGSRRADAAAAGVWVPGGTQEPT
jgi:hypothetical protein